MNIARNTAKRMLESIEQQLHSLAQEQQFMNGNKGGSAQFRCGGKIRRRHMGPGGYNNPQLPYENRTPGWPQDQSAQNALQYIQNMYMPGYGSEMLKQYNPQQNLSATNPAGMTGDYTPNPMNYGTQAIPGRNVLPYSGNDWQMVPNAPMNVPGTGNRPLKKVALDPTTLDPRAAAVSGKPTWAGNIGGMNQHLMGMMPQFGQAKTDIGTANPMAGGLQKSNNPFGDPNFKRPGASGSAMDWLGLLPTAFNLGAGIFSGKAQHLNANQFQNPYEGQALAQMPSEYRIDPLLNEYKNAYANTIRNINNQGNSRGERMANYGAAANQYGAQTSGAWAEKNNQENQMATRRAMMMNEQGQQRARTNLGVQEMNDQNLAAARQNRMGYLGAAASGAERYGLVNRQMANQQSAQDAWLWAIKNQPHQADWVLDPRILADYYSRNKQKYGSK